MLNANLIAAGLGIEELSDTVVIGEPVVASDAPVVAATDLPAPVVDDVVIEEVPATEIEAVEVAAAQAENDVVIVNDSIDNMNATSDALESFRETLVGSLATGGLYPQSAAILKQSVNTLLSYNGLQTTNSVPSLEAFGGTADRKDSTQASIEALDDVIGKVKQVIKDLIEKLVAAFEAFFDKQAKKIGTLGNWAKSVKARAAKAGAAKEGKANASKQLAYEGKVSHAGIVAGLKAFNASSAGVESGCEDYISPIVRLLGKLREDGANVKEVSDEFDALKIEKVVPGFLGVVETKFSKDGVYVVSEEEGGSLDYLSGKEAEQIADAVLDVVTQLEALKKSSDEWISNWAKIAKTMEKEAGTEKGNLALKIVNFTAPFNALRSVQALAANSCFAALKLCDESIGSSKDKKAE